MLAVLTIERIIHEVLVNQNLGVLNVDMSDMLILFLDGRHVELVCRSMGKENTKSGEKKQGVELLYPRLVMWDDGANAHFQGTRDTWINLKVIKGHGF